MKSGESKFFQKSIVKSLPLHVPCTWPLRVSGRYKNIRQQRHRIVGEKPPWLNFNQVQKIILTRRRRKSKREELPQGVIDEEGMCEL